MRLNQGVLCSFLSHNRLCINPVVVNSPLRKYTKPVKAPSRVVKHADIYGLWGLDDAIIKIHANVPNITKSNICSAIYINAYYSSSHPVNIVSQRVCLIPDHMVIIVFMEPS